MPTSRTAKELDTDKVDGWSEGQTDPCVSFVTDIEWTVFTLYQGTNMGQNAESDTLICQCITVISASVTLVHFIQYIPSFPAKMELERVSRKLASDIASYLGQANVPNLFGWLALAMAGSPGPEFLNDVNFVIPDGQMSAAIETMVAAGYPLCADTSCSEFHFV
ncbi:hypothetical protein BDV10DRAFT_183838 [Aspergillus recurvatus]